MKKELDHIDHKIITALTDNARISITELSSIVNLSRNAITYRIKRLETLSIIKGYTTILGNELAEDKSVVASIMVYRKDRMRNNEVIDYANKISEVQSCYIVSGEHDIFLLIKAPSQKRIHEIWQSISNLKSVEDTNTVFVLSKTK
jgi:Lrp/AsnC family leucine-responsive transcriptional regulator|tara:strand:- start:838 stop:1275 length:438 start_codon:yes stop_codon:yes gene_type:complete